GPPLCLPLSEPEPMQELWLGTARYVRQVGRLRSRIAPARRSSSDVGATATRKQGGTPPPAASFLPHAARFPHPAPRPPVTLRNLEREKGFEPSTSTLARWHRRGSTSMISSTS